MTTKFSLTWNPVLWEFNDSVKAQRSAWTPALIHDLRRHKLNFVLSCLNETVLSSPWAMSDSVTVVEKNHTRDFHNSITTSPEDFTSLEESHHLKSVLMTQIETCWNMIVLVHRYFCSSAQAQHLSAVLFWTFLPSTHKHCRFRHCLFYWIKRDAFSWRQVQEKVLQSLAQ